MKRAGVLSRLGYGAFALLAALLFVLGLFRPVMGDAKRVAAGLILFFPPGVLILWGLSAWMSRWPKGRAALALAVLCLAVKLLWVLAFPIDPEVDYRRFFETAAALADSYRIQSRYVALFPHIMGYALFLSGLFGLLGKSVLVATVANALLSVLSMLLIFYICDRTAGSRAAVAGALLWTVYPSQTMFNMFVLSEPLYTAVLLLIWAAVVYVGEKTDARHQGLLAAAGVVLPLLLAFLNLLRPIALVQLLAFLIYAALGYRKEGVRTARIAAVALSVLICYLCFGAMSSVYLERRLGERAAGVPGYNIYVGLNLQSRGTWNPEDSNRLFMYSAQPGWDADRAQRQMLRDAIERLRAEASALPGLMLDKFLILLGDDSAPVFYAGEAIPHRRMAAILCNVFYYGMVLLSLIGALRAMRRKSVSPLLMIGLFGLGLTAAQLLVEVAGRYHYAISLSFLLFASCAFGKSSNNNNSYSRNLTLPPNFVNLLDKA